MFEIINDYEPRAKEEEAYFRIIDYDNINDLSETDVRSLLMILNHACKERNNYISQLCSLKEKRDDEANLIMNKLLVSVRPSEALVNKIDNYLYKFTKLILSLLGVKKSSIEPKPFSLSFALLAAASRADIYTHVC